MLILGIDPGTNHSAAVLWDAIKSLIVDKVDIPNQDMLWHVWNTKAELVAIEMMENQGMPVGMTTFWTLRWLGRFEQVAVGRGLPVWFYRRSKIRLHICGSIRAKDANVRQALINRYGDWEHGKTGVGDKKHPGRLYGVHEHMFSALTVALLAAEEPDKREPDLIELSNTPKEEKPKRKRALKTAPAAAQLQ